MDMPDGALGFRAAGKLEVSDVTETIMPPISEVLAADGRLRTMFILYDDFEVGFDPRLLWKDLVADFNIVGKHRDNVERSAIATNIDWLRRWMKLGGWIAPGDAKLFKLEEVDEAKAWVAA